MRAAEMIADGLASAINILITLGPFRVTDGKGGYLFYNHRQGS